jgi:hypothetical protein
MITEHSQSPKKGVRTIIHDRRPGFNISFLNSSKANWVTQELTVLRVNGLRPRLTTKIPGWILMDEII